MAAVPDFPAAVYAPNEQDESNDSPVGAGEDLVPNARDYNAHDAELKAITEVLSSGKFAAHVVGRDIAPDAAWPEPSQAGQAADATYLWLPVITFDGTNSEGMGFGLWVPSQATTMRIELLCRAATPGIATVKLDLHWRGVLQDAALPGAWTETVLDDLTTAADAQFHRYSTDVDVAAEAIPTGEVVLFELVRDSDDAADTLNAVDLNVVRGAEVTFLWTPAYP